MPQTLNDFMTTYFGAQLDLYLPLNLLEDMTYTSSFKVSLSNPGQISKINAMVTFYGSLNVYTFLSHPGLYIYKPSV